MADETWTLTADFDGGTKSNSSGNFEVETISDNLTITANQIELGNKFSDTFTFADTDADTWKWENIKLDYGTSSEFYVNISDGKLNMRIDVVVFDEYGDNNIVLKDVMLTGDFDVQVDYLDWDNANGSAFYDGLVFSDSKNWEGSMAFGVYRYHDVIAEDNDGYMGASWTGTTTNIATADTSGKMRVTRIGTQWTYYYWDNVGLDWVQIQQDAVDYDGDVYVYLYATNYAITVPSYAQINYDNFKINSGTLVNDGVGSGIPYRTTGSWESESLTPTDTLSNIKIDYSGVDAENYIDKVEIIKTSNDSVISTYGTNITSGSTISLIAENFDNGFDVTKGIGIKIKVYLIGDETTSPIITEILANYEITEAGGPVNLNFSKVVTL